MTAAQKQLIFETAAPYHSHAGGHVSPTCTPAAYAATQNTNGSFVCCHDIYVALFCV